MKIIVIGGTGLLGHEAVEYALSQAHEVTSMEGEIKSAMANFVAVRKCTVISSEVERSPNLWHE